MKKKPALMSLRGISLRYGAVNALQDVNLEIEAGEIHALIGEHGAGKSSLAHIMSGFTRSAGTVSINGEDFDSFNAKTARNRGVSYVTQGTELFDHLPVAFNLFNNDPGIFRNPIFFNRRIYSRAKDFLDSVGYNINPKTPVGELSLPEKVMIDVLRHIYRRPKLLILDEALEKLTAVDLNIVRRLLRGLKDGGSSIIFITHRIDDVYEFADRVTILRNGRVMVSDTVGNIDKINLIKLAYTQMVNLKGFAGVDKEFYHLLKYNEAILEFLPISLLVVDRNSRIKLINNCCETFFGYKREGMLNTEIGSFLGDENIGLQASVRRILGRKTPETIYNEAVVTRGTETRCNIVIYPISDGNYYIGSIVIIDDITEQEKLREKISFSEKLASVGLLAAGVAHEINNPLEILNNYLDVLKTEVRGADAEQYLSYMEEELDSIDHIVGNLITFSDNRRCEDEELDIGKLIRRMIKLIKPNSDMRGITLSYTEPPEAVRIFAGRIKIKQVILNIIKNAFDAMPGGGSIEITLSRSGGKLNLEFLDSGTGLAGNKLGNLFLPFYTTKTDGGGNMGLGLSIVYGIIDSYGGTVDITNRTDGPGCSVRLSLPVITKEAPV